MDGTQQTTDLGYTGQRNYSYINLLDYGARWYSSALGRFVQPDSIVPDLTDMQAWNRYSYTNNNPVNYNDPSGHVLVGTHYTADIDSDGWWVTPVHHAGDNYLEWIRFFARVDIVNLIPQATSTESNNVCDPVFGAGACEAWNEAFDPWYGYPEDVQNDLEQLVAEGAYGGYDNLEQEANECIATGLPENCENP